MPQPTTDQGVQAPSTCPADHRSHAVDVPSRGTVAIQADLVLAGYLREAVRDVGRADPVADGGGQQLRLIGPDPTSQGLPDAVLRVADRRRTARSGADDAFLDHLLTTQAGTLRVYLPPDANCLLAVVDRCLRSRADVNLVVAGKQPLPQWLTLAEAEVHCAAGIGAWGWASNDHDGEPDAVLACCGDSPTLEVLAAASILHEHLPEVRIRVVNVVDLMTLQSEADHPHGLSDAAYDALFTADRPVVFAFHGHPWWVHRLIHRRPHRSLHVCGRIDEGPVTTPFDGRVRNRWDRFHLVQAVVDRLPELGASGARLRALMADSLLAHAPFVTRYGLDLPEVREWTWARP